MSEPTTSLPLDLMLAGSRFASAPALVELEGGAFTVESSLDPLQAVRARGSASSGSALRRRWRTGRTSWWRIDDRGDSGTSGSAKGSCNTEDVSWLAALRTLVTRWEFPGNPRPILRAPPAVAPSLTAALEHRVTAFLEDLAVVSATDRDADPAFALHRGGKIEIALSVPLETRDDLSLAYTPGVARICTAIAEEPDLVYDYTWMSRTVAVVTDGTAVLGLGDIGAKAALPVMEGKAMLFKHFGGVDAVPICLDVTDTDELIETVVRLAPAFGGINLEDISAPRCFEVERRVQERLDIPVFHDDQHGTAIVTLAALRNAAKVTGRTLGDLRVVVSGAGAAGIAVSKMILEAGIGDLAIADSKGIVHLDRTDLNDEKRMFAEISNKAAFTGSFDDALAGADVFLGLSSGKLTLEDVQSMAPDAICFAM